MNKENEMSIHQKMELLIEEMVEKELPLPEALNEFKKIYIQTVGKKCNGTKTRMADALGIHRNTLNHITKKLKIKQTKKRR